MAFQAIILTDIFNLSIRSRPAGAYAVANALRQNGYSCLVIDYISQFDVEELSDILQRSISDCTLFVGYSSSFFSGRGQDLHGIPVNFEWFTGLNKFIRSINSNIKIVFGGASSVHFQNFIVRNRENCSVDFIVHGFAESMIVDICKSLDLKKTPKYNQKIQGTYIIDYDKLGGSFNFRNSLHSWNQEDIVGMQESLPLEVARGCIFKCKFCAYPLLGKNKSDVSYLRTEQNLERMFLENYEKYKTTDYLIVDDTFNERIDKLEILARIRDKTKIDLHFGGYLRVDLIHRDQKQIKLLKEVNFVAQYFGLESLNYASAKVIGKGIKPEHTVETLEKIKSEFNNSVLLTASFIIGLPYETFITFNKWHMEVSDQKFPLTFREYHPLTLSESGHSKSEFLNNPESFGYRRVEGKPSWFWENDYWNHRTVQILADRSNKEQLSSSQSRISTLRAFGLRNLGIGWDEIFKSSLQEILSKYDTLSAFKNNVQIYKTKLRQFLEDCQIRKS